MIDAVDRLIDIRTQIAALQLVEQELEDLIKDDGVGRHEGTILDALVYKQTRHYTNWKALAVFLRIPKRTIIKFTEGQDVICLKIVTKRSFRRSMSKAA